MNSLFALRTLLFAGDLLAGSTLTLVFAWLATAQRSASARHLLWAAAFGVCLALPLLAAIMPSAIQILLFTRALPQSPNAMAFDTALPQPEAHGVSFSTPLLAAALTAMWLIGVCAVSLRMAAGAVGLALLKRRSRSFALTPEDEPKVAASHRECELRLCDEDIGPITWGVLTPVILLPNGALSWPRERLQAVLLHELAHIRRRDSLVQFLSQCACALYWPNPLVWMAAKRLRREAEMAADDSAIRWGVKPSAYAGELLQLAQEFRPQEPSNLAFCMAAPSALKARVESLLSPTQSRSGVTKMDVVKIAGLGLLAAAAIAFAFPSLAQETEQPIAATAAAPEAPQAVEVAPAPPVAPTPTVQADPATPPHPAAPATAAEPATHVWVDGRNWDSLGSADRARIRTEIAKANRKAREAMAKARPEMERAMAEARAGEQAIRDAQPKIDAAMAEVAHAKPEIDRAMAEVQPEIDRALAKVRVELARQHLDARIQERVDTALQRAEIKIEAARARVKDTDRDEDRVEEDTETTDDK